MYKSQSVALVLAVILWGGCASERDPEIVQMASEIDLARVTRTVHVLVGFGTRNTLSDTNHPTRGIGAARRWLKSEFDKIAVESAGRLRVELDEFTAEADNRRITRPTQIVNVVATLPGTRAIARDRVYVLSAHYDSMCSDPTDPNCDAPGADDDASGVAVVLELARVMSRYEFDATIVFMAVAGEEQGLVGSRHWAKQAKQRKMDIAGMITNDIVGASVGPTGAGHRHRLRVFSEGVPINETPEQARIRQATGNENESASRNLARYIQETAAEYLPGMNVVHIFRRDRFLRGGDHSAFLEQGYPAVRFTEYEENYDHQHQTPRVEAGREYGDLPKFCDFGYIADVARVNLVALANLARAPAVPRDVRIITARLSHDTTLRWTAGREADMFGYEVVWRETTSPVWQERRFVGNVTEVTLPMSKDNNCFGVCAIDGLAHRSPAASPVPALD
ncbi:MAG: M20/M25/M40 family metallo-hydrolase [Phycisphaerae bacterium]|nr:M20/M25/M40 family metallo-hydrolase [Phycisphaerae bacterium]